MNKTKKTVLGVVLAFTLFAGQAQASLIVGSIGLGGTYAPLPAGDLALATSINVTGAIVLDAYGDFAAAGLGLGSPVNHNDFVFDPVTVPVTPLWATTSLVDNFSFDLNSMVVETQDSNHIVISGTGTMHRNGYDDTLGYWAFTANNVGTSFTWSSSNAVPEPSMLALLGLGLLGFAGSRRLNKK